MMAKINVEFDTKDKVLSVSMDGKDIGNVSSVEFFSGYDDDKFHGSITTIEKMDDDDIHKIMRISAEQNGFVEITEESNLPRILANKLFPSRVV